MLLQESMLQKVVRQKDQVKGQAKALRAFCYLNIASFYQFSYLKDKSALMRQFIQNLQQQALLQKKSSLEDVYTLIKSDLTDADNF
jgi:hypothetical protein